MSLPPKASFSSATTAVASRSTAYPSVEEFTSFSMPSTPKIVEPTQEDVPEIPDKYNKARRLDPRPSTPIPPSPIPTEASDRDFIFDDTPSTVRGQSMLMPRHPLANRNPSGGIPVSPRWPFQNATPRVSVMAPITRSVTDSSSRFNKSARGSPPGQVSVSESLDEFQLNHPNAQLLALDPPPLSYRDATRMLVNVPELVEKPDREVQSTKGVPVSHKGGQSRLFHNRRWSHHFLNFHLHRRHKKRNSSALLTTFWYQRISTHRKTFQGSAAIAIFFVASSFVSVTALITLDIAGLSIPHGLIVWVIVSVITCTFTAAILLLMIRFRRAVAFDEENRGRSLHSKLYYENHPPLAASSDEVAHRRQLGAATKQEQEAMHGHPFSERTIDVPDMAHVMQATPIHQAVEHVHDTASVHPTANSASMPQISNDPVEKYWAGASTVTASKSDASSITAVIATAPKAPANTPRSNF